MNQRLFWWPLNYFFFFQRETAIQTSQAFPPSKQQGNVALRSPPLPQPQHHCKKTLRLSGVLPRPLAFR